MSAPRPKKSKPPNLVAELRRDAVKGKVPNMPRYMYRGTLNVLLDKADWSTGHNAFVSKATISKGWTGGSERKIVYDLKHLRGGGWIEEQKEGPDTDQARLTYYGDGTEEHPGIRADRRPTVYRVNFQVFYAEPRPATGCKNDTPSADATGCKNDTPTGCKIRRHGVQTVAPNHPMTSDTTYPRSTDSSKNEESPRKINPPPRAGGRTLSDPESYSPAPASQKELRQTVKVALKILEKPRAIMSTEASWVMTAALEDLTTRWKCCLECALLVPYWVAHGSTRHGTGENLQGLNKRTDLDYLWGSNWGNLMANATLDAREDGSGTGYLNRRGFDETVADLTSVAGGDLYDDERPLDDYPLIEKACRWCPKGKRRVHPSPDTDPANTETTS